MSSERPWTDEESTAAFAQLGDRIIDVTRRWSRSRRRARLAEALYRVGDTVLTLGQVDALEAVAAGDMRMHELAQVLAVDPSTATRIVTPLVDEALIDRQPDPSDRRYVTLCCTDAGRLVAGRINRERRRLMQGVLEPMEPRRRLLLADLLEEFLELTDRYADNE